MTLVFGQQDLQDRKTSFSETVVNSRRQGVDVLYTNSEPPFQFDGIRTSRCGQDDGGAGDFEREISDELCLTVELGF